LCGWQHQKRLLLRWKVKVERILWGKSLKWNVPSVARILVRAIGEEFFPGATVESRMEGLKEVDIMPLARTPVDIAGNTLLSHLLLDIMFGTTLISTSGLPLQLRDTHLNANTLDLSLQI
jgi:hypothetical protein